jgi:acyl-homoserine lactone acylase PvdQ
MMDIRTNSSNNTVYADSDGTIAYYHGNFMPKRDPGFNYSEPVDGSNPNTDWNGLHTVDESISIVNPKNGWIQNANSTPFTAAAEYSPKREDYPAYMAPDAENFRGVHGIQVLTGKSGFTLDNLIETAYDSYLPGFAALIPGLVEAYDRAPQKDTSIAGAIDALRNWDFRVAVDSVPMSLAHFYGMNYRAQGKTPKGLSGMERLTFFGKQSPDEERLAVFKQTVDQVTRDFGQWDTPWGEINRLQRLSGDIKAGFDDEKPSLAVGLASGRWGALAAYGSRTGENTKRLYGYRGNSFVAVVEFGDKVKAKTLLAGGQSGDPKSPHFYDQAQRYVEHSFKDVAYYREDVEKRAVTRYSPGQN